MHDLLVLVVVGIGTLALRAAFLVRRDPEVPAAARTVLPHVPPAVIAAIAVPALLMPGGALQPGEAAPATAAAALTALTWWRTHGFARSLAVGLGTWWLLLAVLP